MSGLSKLLFWRKPRWENLGSVTFNVPAGSYKATTTIKYEKGIIDKTIIVVPTISVQATNKAREV